VNAETVMLKEVLQTE